MHKTLYTFVNANNVIYNLQYGFRQHYSSSNALINMKEILAVEFLPIYKKAFGAVDHQNTINTNTNTNTNTAKLNHYEI